MMAHARGGDAADLRRHIRPHRKRGLADWIDEAHRILRARRLEPPGQPRLEFGQRGIDPLIAMRIGRAEHSLFEPRGGIGEGRQPIAKAFRK